MTDAARQNRLLIIGLMAALLAWGAYLGIGAAFFSASHTQLIKGAILLGFMAAFLGFWMLMLASRQRRLAKQAQSKPVFAEQSSDFADSLRLQGQNIDFRRVRTWLARCFAVNLALIVGVSVFLYIADASTTPMPVREWGGPAFLALVLLLVPAAFFLLLALFLANMLGREHS